MTEKVNTTPKLGKEIELLNQSLNYYEEAQKIAHEINDFPNEALIYNKIGQVYHQLSDFKKASQAFEESIKLFVKTGDSSNEIDTLIQLAKVKEILNQSKEAQDFYEKAAIKAANSNKMTKEEYCYGQLGLSFLKTELNYKRALEWFEKSLRLSLKMGTKKNEAKWLYYIGCCSQKLGKIKVAIDKHSDSIVISKEISDYRMEALNYGELGRINATLNEQLAAISAYESAIILFESLNEKEIQARFLIDQGDIYYETGAIDQARNAYETAGRIISKTTDRKLFETILGKIGIAYLNAIKDNKMAIKYFNKATEIAEAIGDKGDYIQWLGKLAEAETKDLQYLKSNEHYIAAIKEAELFGNNEVKSLLVLGLGSNYYKMGDMNEASKEFTRALEIIEETKNEFHKLDILFALSEVYTDLNNYQKAISNYEEVLSIAKKLNQPEKEFQALYCLGENYKNNKQYKEALEKYENALKIAQQLEDKKQEHNQLGNIGAVYLLINDIQNAKKYLQNALTKAKEIEDRIGRGKWTGYLGNVYYFEKNLPIAVQNYEEAVKVFKRIGLRKDECYWLNKLATALKDEDMAKSIEINLRALELAIQIQDNELLLNISDELGQLFLNKNDYSSSIQHFNKALELAKNLGEQEKEIFILFNLGKAYFAIGTISGAIKAFENCLLMVDIVKKPTFEVENLIELGKCHLSLNDEEKANEYFMKANGLILKLGDNKNEEILFGSIAEAYLSTTQKAKAKEYLLKAMEKAETSANKTIWNLKYANLLLDKQHYTDAYKEYKKVLESINEIKKEEQAEFYANLGRTLNNISKTKTEFTKTEEFYKKAIALAEELKLNINLIRWQKEMGDIYFRREELEKAENYYTLAHEHSKHIKNRMLEEGILISLGDLSSKKKEEQQAIQYYKEALFISRDQEQIKILKEKIKVLELKTDL